MLSWQEVLCLNSLMMAENATSMLWISSPLSSQDRSGPSGCPICLAPCQSPAITTQVSEGVAGIARIKGGRTRLQLSLSDLRRYRFFEASCLSLTRRRRLKHFEKGFGRTAFRNAASGFSMENSRIASILPGI